MTARSTILAALAAAHLCASTALAQGTGSEGYFTIYNDTTDNIVVGFYTNDGSGWSDNWLATDALMPGDSALAEFQDESGPCEQVFAVGWLGANGSEIVDDPIAIDICDASNVYLGDNEITYD